MVFRPNFTNVNVVGLTNIQPGLSLKLAGFKFNYSLTWPSVNAFTDYNLTVYIGVAPLSFGLGNIS